jgi:hypothetical protein
MLRVDESSLGGSAATAAEYARKHAPRVELQSARGASQP